MNSLVGRKSRHAPPSASAMFEALRGLGYSTSTALADIIDNSITAKASTVNLTFIWRGAESLIAIQDDGVGMDDAELDCAMRLGVTNPLAYRDISDLGRFGLGLKTASCSQCRRLTVSSRKFGKTSCLCWDLDIIAASEGDGWQLLEGPEETSRGILENLMGYGSGTVVLWEKLDRIVTSNFSEQNFLDLIDQVERHLALVFHRFLTVPNALLQIFINSRPIIPWDPFLINHPTTWSSPIATINSAAGNIKVQCHVLPHQDRLNPEVYNHAAGKDGWTAQQGFYVYRNRRLLVAGSWLGLGKGRTWTKEEAHRLARVRIDIPNSADAEWKIDIRKSTARPPVSLRSELTRLAEDTRGRARRVFAHRGQTSRLGDNREIAQAWQCEHFSGGMRYRIDRKHPVVQAVFDEAGSLTSQIKVMLRIIEETIPVQRIWLDTTEGQETPRTGFAGGRLEEVGLILKVMFNNLVNKKGISADQARKQLLHTEPFHSYPDLVDALSCETIDKE